jgi:hypothetical protein
LREEGLDACSIDGDDSDKLLKVKEFRLATDLVSERQIEGTCGFADSPDGGYVDTLNISKGQDASEEGRDHDEDAGAK